MLRKRQNNNNNHLRLQKKLFGQYFGNFGGSGSNLHDY